MKGVAVAGGFRISRCLSLHHSHVSSPRSSNRACGFPAPGSRTRSCLRPRKAFACSAVWSVRTLLELLGVSTSLHVLASFLRCSRTEAPSLRRHYPTSPVLRASPPPRRPKLVLADSRLASTRHRRGFPCCCCLPLHACRRQYPGGTGRCPRHSLPDRCQPSPY